MIDQFHFSQNLLNFILPVAYIQRHESILEVTELYTCTYHFKLSVCFILHYVFGCGCALKFSTSDNLLKH